jgi:sarcosine oxidase subunit beta
MKTAGAVIIGGGVIGSGIAYHLALKGLKDIVVLDKFTQPGLGSTGKATGGFRAQFGSEINVKLSLLAYQKLLSFKDETGVDPEFKQQGYLFMAQNEEEFSRLKKANALHKSCGVSAQILLRDEIQKLNPHINYNGIIGGIYNLSDGFINPLRILEGYKQSAEKLGVEFLYNTEVKQLTVKNGKIISAITNNETIEAGIIINAAGAWAGETAKLAGIEIPLEPLKRQVCSLTEKNILPAELPMTVWIDNSFHFRIRGGRVILLLPCEPENKEAFDMQLEQGWLEKVFGIAGERIPVLKNCTVDKQNSWAGLYEMSPDEHIMLGLAPGMENFYLANGSSGHGVMHSPAIGQLLAELITDGSASTDISSLSPNRFNEGNEIKSIEFF